ncbi:isopentenyl-diphosphate Delta-isomerase [Pseudomonas panipatensis]|uniref:isopentenyl-diphosphate Delta-isomerase n=1 Tax=Pseudomonas panipatensis TaxID=428992 RepID=UPI0035B2BE6D
MSHIDVVLVDEQDNPLGLQEKLEAHRRGLLHRAISVYVLNSAGELLLQRRAAGKYHCGGLWSNSCCGHPFPGETPLDAAQRRLREEMGLDLRLQPALETRYRTELPGGMVENEYCHLYFAVDDQAPRLAPEEADAFRYLSFAGIDAELGASAPAYTPWFRACYPAFKAFWAGRGASAAQPENSGSQ